MALIGLTNNYIVGVPTKAQRIEEWCEEHIGPYNKGWYWVSTYKNSLILRIIDDDAAVLFRLTFEEDL